VDVVRMVCNMRKMLLVNIKGKKHPSDKSLDSRILLKQVLSLGCKYVDLTKLLQIRASGSLL
jgi:hypothetical protein